METNTLNITQGKWELNCNPFSCTITVKENHGWKVIATCTDDSGLVKEMQANAQAIASLPTLLKEHGELKAAYKKLLFWIKDCDIVETIEDIDTEFGKELAELCNTGYELLSKSTSTQV